MCLFNGYIDIKEKSIIKKGCTFLYPLCLLIGLIFIYYAFIVVLLKVLPVILYNYLGVEKGYIKSVGFIIIAFGPFIILKWYNQKNKNILLKYETAIKWWSGDVVIYFSMFMVFYFSYDYTLFGYTFNDITNNDLLKILATPQMEGIVGVPYLGAIIRLFCGFLALNKKEKTDDFELHPKKLEQNNNLVTKNKKRGKGRKSRT